MIGERNLRQHPLQCRIEVERPPEWDEVRGFSR
jgi:hypothetical protein